MTYSLEKIDNYAGAGYALAAISKDGLLSMQYIRDIDPELSTAELFVDELSPIEAALYVKGSRKCADFASFLEVPGMTQAVFGLVSAGEFNVL